MGQKNSILHTIDHETIKVLTNAHRQISLPGQDLTLKIAQIFFDNNILLHEGYWRKLIIPLYEIFLVSIRSIKQSVPPSCKFRLLLHVRT